MENKALVFSEKPTSNKEINEAMLSAFSACLLPLTNIYYLLNQEGKDELKALDEEIERLNIAVNKKHQSMREIELLTKKISELLAKVKLVENPKLLGLPEQQENRQKLLAQEIGKLDTVIDQLNEIGHQIEKPKHKKHYFGMGKIITEFKTGIARLARGFRDIFKRHKKEPSSDIPLVKKPEMYTELQKLFEAQKAKLNPMQLANAELFLAALTDLHNNADKHLKTIKDNYRKMPGRDNFLYLDNKRTPFHAECYDPKHKHYEGVPIEAAMNTFHVSMEIILKWAQENDKVEELFKNLPGAHCIDGKMRELEEWHRKVSQPALDIDTYMEICLKKYADFVSLGQHESLDKLKPEYKYVEGVAEYICWVLKRGEIEIKGGYNAETTRGEVEKYLEDVICLDRKPVDTLKH